MEYLLHKQFQASLQALFRKGGPFRKAADQVHAMVQKAQSGMSEKEILDKGLTHHGETRIQHCVKYDLTARARLVVVRHENVTVFLFAGDHEAVDEFLDRNRGLQFAVARGDSHPTMTTLRVSEPTVPEIGLIRTGQDLAASEVLIEMLPVRYQDQLLQGLSSDAIEAVRGVGPLASDDQVEVVSNRVAAETTDGQGECVLDVLLTLREANVQEAKNRIDLFRGELTRAERLTERGAAHLVSGEEVVRVTDLDPTLFEHFARTASFRDWMLYLHPDQRGVSERDYPGSIRVSGVSGSGKTCVLIHRALRLARKRPADRVLVITLNPALSKLIDELVSEARGELRPANLEVMSFWDWCRGLLLEFDPKLERSLTRRTVTPNPHAISEHIDEIWDEFYHARYNYDAYDRHLWELHGTLLLRGIYPHDYIRQEFDYVRSALAPASRDQYLTMERGGRFVPLTDNYRRDVLAGLGAWEAKMTAVGAIDEVGIATMLNAYADRIAPRYRCVLVDEVQDFGTLELSLIRRAVAPGENDLFLCGDAAQSVYTKHHDAAQAGIAFSGKELRLRRSYRNSREILSAAHGVLTRNFDPGSHGLAGLEIIEPELANFSSTPPMLVSAETLELELAHALEYLGWRPGTPLATDRKACVALCGFSQPAIEALGAQLGLPVLSGDIDVIHEGLFVSDLEHTKGFEFDTVVILNCASGVLPHPELPREEAFRDLSRLYVAMTRAKHELILSHAGAPSEFLDPDSTEFATGDWTDYSSPAQGLEALHMPPASLAAKDDPAAWKVPGKEFLKTRDAVGLSAVVQSELLEHVEGRSRRLNGRDVGWRSVTDFLLAMQHKRARTGVISEPAWQELRTRLPLSPAPSQRSAAA